MEPEIPETGFRREGSVSPAPRATSYRRHFGQRGGGPGSSPYPSNPTFQAELPKESIPKGEPMGNWGTAGASTTNSQNEDTSAGRNGCDNGFQLRVPDR